MKKRTKVNVLIMGIVMSLVLISTTFGLQNLTSEPKGTITGITPLEDDVLHQSLEQGLTSEPNLPKSLEVSVLPVSAQSTVATDATDTSDTTQSTDTGIEQEMTLPVTWSSPDFTMDTAGEYLFTCELDEKDYAIDPLVSLPTITVKVVEKEVVDNTPLTIEGNALDNGLQNRAITGKIPELLTVDSQNYIIANGYHVDILPGDAGGESKIAFKENSTDTSYSHFVSAIGGDIDIEPGQNPTSYDFSDYAIIGGTYSTVNVTNDIATSINMAGGNVAAIYGGDFSNGGTTQITSTNITISGGNVEEVFGGGFNYGGTVIINGNTYISISGNSTVVNYVYGAGHNNTIEGNTSINISNGATIIGLYGAGGEYVDLIGNVQIDISDSKVEFVIGGASWDSNIGGNITTNITGSTISKYVVGGGYANNHIGYNEGDLFYEGFPTPSKNPIQINLTITDSTVGEADPDIDEFDEILSLNVFGGGYGNYINGSTNVVIDKSTIYGNVYGGSAPGNDGITTSLLTQNSKVEIKNNSSIINNVYGGGQEDYVKGSTNVTINGGTARNVFGSGYNSVVVQETNVTINQGTINESVYGGGNVSNNIGVTVTKIDFYRYIGTYEAGKGDTNVTINNGTIGQNVYGGGLVYFDLPPSREGSGGYSSTQYGGDVYGDAYITMIGGTVNGSVIGSSNFVHEYVEINLFLNASNQKHDTSIITQIIGGTIKGNIFGVGADEAVYFWDDEVFTNLSSPYKHIYIFLNDGNILAGNIYKYQHRLFPDDILPDAELGQSTVVIDNSTTQVGVQLGDTDLATATADISTSINNIFRREMEPTFTRDHWRIRGNVNLQLLTTGNIEIAQNQELYIPNEANLIAGENGDITFKNIGYIITTKPTLDESIEDNNVSGQTNIGSRIYRGGAGMSISGLRDATYTQNQSATALNGTPAKNSMFTFLGTKVNNNIGYNWTSGVTSFGTNASITPSTASVGSRTYNVTAISQHLFESIKDLDILGSIVANGSATIVVNAAILPPPTTTTGGGGTTPTTATGGGGTTPTTATGGGGDTTPTTATPTTTTPTTTATGGGGTTPTTATTGGGGTSQPEVTPGGGVTLPPTTPGKTPDDLTIGGDPIDPNDYTVGPDGTITLTPEFISTLPDGEHVIRITYGDEVIETTLLVDNGIPLSASSYSIPGWSLFDLIMTILSILSPILFFVLVNKKKKEDEENNDEPEEIKKRRNTTLLAAIAVAIIAVVMFVITQDLTQPMIIFDKYSIWFAILFIAQSAIEILFKRKKNTQDNEPQPVQN